MMRLYTYQEMKAEINQDYTDKVKRYLSAGWVITDLYTDGIQMDNGEANLFCRKENDKFVPIHPWNHKIYVTKKDYEDIIIPLRQHREERKPNYNDYRIITCIPDSLIERLREIDGFKKATKDNLKILRRGKDLIVNCGTKAVMTYDFNFRKYDFENKTWMDSDSFERIYNSARKSI